MTMTKAMGILPLNIKCKTGHPTIFCLSFTQMPPILVIAAKSGSVPAAVMEIMLKAKIYSGVICDSPPLPNNPTKRPTVMPEIV